LLLPQVHNRMRAQRVVVNGWLGLYTKRRKREMGEEEVRGVT
jgi:hypothetical protein